MASFFSALIAIFKAVPILDGYFQQLVKIYYDRKFEDITQGSITKEKKVAAAIKCLQEAKTDEEAAARFAILNDIRNGLQYYPS